MRRQRNIFDTFPETVDLNQGPNFNGLDLNESNEYNSRLSPSERRLLSSDLSGELNKSQGFSSWDVGESSSSRANVQDHVANNLSSSFGTHDSIFSRERQFDHQIPVVQLNMQNSHIPMDVDLNVEYGANSSNDGPGNAAMDASSSGTSNERGTNGNLALFSPMANSREPINPDSSHRSNQQPPLMQLPGIPRNLLPFPWVGSGSSRIGSSSTLGFPRENRNLVQDSTNWSLGTGAGGSSSTNNGGNHPQSSSRNESIWMPNLNSTTREQQRLSDFPPWTLFPSSETESGGHRGHFRHFPSGPSSTSEENGGNSPLRNHQPLLRPLEVPDDEWHTIGADIEGRRRLVSEMRQILHALRRGENLRAEDYMLFDPFINGAADLHDRHRDMRLDVDNMSYEELLALEERIGDVKTGLIEEDILKSMKQRKHFSFVALSAQNLEPCCICREEYENGDDIGSLDCGHDFHTCCIKEWLTQKNLCPICKMTALST